MVIAACWAAKLFAAVTRAFIFSMLSKPEPSALEVLTSSKNAARFSSVTPVNPRRVRSATLMLAVMPVAAESNSSWAKATRLDSLAGELTSERLATSRPLLTSASTPGLMVAVTPNSSRSAVVRLELLSSFWLAAACSFTRVSAIA